jgi:hypothetical protein
MCTMLGEMDDKNMVKPSGSLPCWLPLHHCSNFLWCASLLSEIELLHREFVIAQRHEERDKNDFSHVFSSTILIRRKVLSTQHWILVFLKRILISTQCGCKQCLIRELIILSAAAITESCRENRWGRALPKTGTDWSHTQKATSSFWWVQGGGQGLWPVTIYTIWSSKHQRNVETCCCNPLQISLLFATARSLLFLDNPLIQVCPFSINFHQGKHCITRATSSFQMRIVNVKLQEVVHKVLGGGAYNPIHFPWPAFVVFKYSLQADYL